MMTYNEFRAKRIQWQEEYCRENPWAKGLETDFEGVTKLAYRFYLKGKVPSWAKK